MTNQDHERIYLQPECCADPETGRLWCQHDAPEDCDDGVAWTEYVRADLKAEAAAATLQAMGYTIERLSAENESLRAQLDQRTDALAEIKSLEAELDRSRADVITLKLHLLAANNIRLDSRGGSAEHMQWLIKAMELCALPSTPSKEQN